MRPELLVGDAGAEAIAKARGGHRRGLSRGGRRHYAR